MEYEHIQKGRLLKGRMNGGYSFPMRYQTSSREYECDGCAGEFPIPADTLYGKIATRAPDGKMAQMRLCIRCVCALLNRQQHTEKGFTIRRGSLRLRCLSSQFRKSWNAFLAESQQGEAGKELSVKLLHEMGIHGITEEQEKRMKEQKSEKKATRKAERERQATERLKRSAADFCRTLATMLDDLARLHLQETLAWTNGDRAKIDEVKTAYGAGVQRIRKAIAEWAANNTEDKNDWREQEKKQ